jgi:hypothetical protein
MDDKIYDQPSDVDAEDGKVVIDGPDGVAVLMTPNAALETSDRLLWGASKAQGQLSQMRGRAGAGTEKPEDGLDGAAFP